MTESFSSTAAGVRCTQLCIMEDEAVVLEVVLKVLEVMPKVLEVVNGVQCMGAGGHALHAVPYAVPYAAANAALYAALYSGGRGGRVPFARGARVTRHLPELRALRVVSCAPRAGGREGRAACVVVAVICCVLLVHERYVMYAGGWRLCSMRLTCWTVCACVALYAGGCGG
jgi:hypothetical protein